MDGRYLGAIYAECVFLLVIYGIPYTLTHNDLVSHRKTSDQYFSFLKSVETLEQICKRIRLFGCCDCLLGLTEKIHNKPIVGLISFKTSICYNPRPTLHIYVKIDQWAFTT